MGTLRNLVFAQEKFVYKEEPPLQGLKKKRGRKMRSKTMAPTRGERKRVHLLSRGKALENGKARRKGLPDV